MVIALYNTVLAIPFHENWYISLSTVVVTSYIGIGMVPNIIDVWGYDRVFCMYVSIPW